MLLTTLQAYEDATEQMPNEERLDKVDESMANLEEVVRERNRAYYDLEVGDWRGEQPCCNLIDAHHFSIFSTFVEFFASGHRSHSTKSRSAKIGGMKEEGCCQTLLSSRRKLL